MSNHPVILSANGAVIALSEIIQAAYPDYTEDNTREAINELLDGLVSKCRDKDKALRLSKAWIGYVVETHLDLPPYPYHALTVDSEGKVDTSSKLQDKRKAEEVLFDLAKDICEQMSTHGLYDKDGRLMYIFHEVTDTYFNDVALMHFPYYSVNDEDE